MSERDGDREVETLLGMLGVPMIDELSTMADRSRALKNLKRLLRDPAAFAQYRASEDYPKSPEWDDNPFSIPESVRGDARSVFPEISKPAQQNIEDRMVSMAMNTRTGSLSRMGPLTRKVPKSIRTPGPMRNSREVQFAEKALRTFRNPPPFADNPRLFDPGSGGMIRKAQAGELPGMLGGIDLSRPKLKNPDGSFSTEETITIEADGLHYLIPTIIDGVRVKPDMAVVAWKAGVNPAVGVFKSAEEAARAAVERSKRIGELRGME